MTKPFTESELLRLCQRLAEAEEAGYVIRKAWLCDLNHKHNYRISRWLCNFMWRWGFRYEE